MSFFLPFLSSLNMSRSLCSIKFHSEIEYFEGSLLICALLPCNWQAPSSTVVGLLPNVQLIYFHKSYGVQKNGPSLKEAI